MLSTGIYIRLTLLGLLTYSHHIAGFPLISSSLSSRSLSSHISSGITSPLVLLNRNSSNSRKQPRTKSILPFHYNNNQIHGNNMSLNNSMSMSSSLVPQIGRTAFGLTVAYKLSSSGLKKGSLNKSGSIAAFVVASLAYSCSIRCGMTLVAFYWTGSKLTKVGAKRKGKLEEDYAEAGNRGAKQVLACSFVAVLCAVLRRILVGIDTPLNFAATTTAAATTLGNDLGNRFTLAYVAFFACCAGDTWASELGILSKQPPRLITKPWKTAVPGTNGGVSLLGTFASGAGGACMGFCHALGMAIMGRPSPSIIVRETLSLIMVGLLSGLGGSLLDSLLGATIQATYYDPDRNLIVKKPTKNTEQRGGFAFLSNEGVNVVSTVLTTAIVAVLTPSLLGWFAL